MKDYFTKLPHEVLHNVLKDVSPRDLAMISRCCGELHRFIADNRPLYKELYLTRLDEPPERPNCVEYDWVEEVRKFVTVRRILGPGMSVAEKTQHLAFITDTVSRWMQTAAPGTEGGSLNVQLLTDLFEDQDNQEAFFCNSTIFGRTLRDRQGASQEPVPFRPYSERQMSAKLHTMYGLPINFPRGTRFNTAYPYACSVVYDLRNYTEGNMWGPYMDDGLCTVDWERLESVMVVLGHNMRALFTGNTRGIFQPLWAVPWYGATPDSYRPMALGKLREQPAPPVDAGDPYNVAGSWMRIVCFLDFNELFAYNFSQDEPAEGEPRPPIETTEATRLIMMEVSVDRITEPEENDGKDLPVVHFKGTSRSMHSQWDPNANSNIKGTVRLTKEGEVRWTSISVYQGEERWKSEGIQIGGVRSSRGVLGHWFDKDHDRHGPAGPTAFWKISNEIDKRLAEIDTDDDYFGNDDEDDGEEDDEMDEEEFDVADFNIDEIMAVLGAVHGGAVHGQGSTTN